MKINRTASRTIQILDYISLQNRGATVAELSAHFEIPKTSIYDIVMALVQEKMLQVTWHESKCYQLGIRAFEIGNRLQTDFSAIAQDALRQLNHQLDATTFLAAEDQGSIVYLGKYEPAEPVVTTAALGARRPMYCTALGKAILAAYPDAEVAERIAANPIAPKTEYTVKNLDELLADLREIRQLGYAVDNREQEIFLQCVAAPLFDHSARVLAAISISLIYKSDEDLPALGRAVRETALQISRQLGYGKNKLYSLSSA